MSLQNPVLDSTRHDQTTLPATAESKRNNASALATAPDPLTRAFNDALKPYLERIEVLQTSLEDTNAYVQSLEKDKAKLTAWIDERGLRPGMRSQVYCDRITLQ